MTWHDLGEPGIVPPGFRDPISEQSMDSRLAVQLMKDALCSAIQGGHVRLEEVLPARSPSGLRPRAHDPQLRVAHDRRRLRRESTSPRNS